MIVKIEGKADEIQLERNRPWRWRIPGGLFPGEGASETSDYSAEPVIKNVIRFWYNRQASSTPPDLAEPAE